MVGGEEVLAQAQADHQRAAAAGCHDAVRLAGADHGQTVGTVQLFDRGLEGGGQVAVVLELVVEQVGDHFGVGVRGEDVAQALELFTQHFMVFDDAVVHHRQVAREVRVSVTLARSTVGGPTGVGDP